MGLNFQLGRSYVDLGVERVFEHMCSCTLKSGMNVKNIKRIENIFRSFVDLEKAHDTSHRHRM